MTSEKKSTTFYRMNGSTNLVDYEPGGKFFMRGCFKAENHGELLSKICGIYRIVRPDFIKVISLSATPLESKERIKTFIGFMDTICM